MYVCPLSPVPQPARWPWRVNIALVLVLVAMLCHYSGAWDNWNALPEAGAQTEATLGPATVSETDPPLYCMDQSEYLPAWFDVETGLSGGTCRPWPTHCMSGWRFVPPTVISHWGCTRWIGVWDVLADCEAGGNWFAVSRTGTYRGGIQADASFWRAYGGHEYAPSANRATRDQQITVAERGLRAQGWGAWPACSRKLGFR